MNRPRALPIAAMALAVVLGTTSAAGAAGVDDAGCDPGIREALAASAAWGVEQDLAVIRNPDQGIRDPDSILDFSCLKDLFNYRPSMCCSIPAARLRKYSAWHSAGSARSPAMPTAATSGRTLDATVYTERLPRLPGLHRLPGLDTDAHYGNVLRDSGVKAERFRGVVGGGQ